MDLTPEQLFRLITEMTIENRLLRDQLIANQQKLIEAEKKIKESEEKMAEFLKDSPGDNY